MKYLPLLALGLLAAPAFADDVNVKAMPIPNEIAPVGPASILCHLTGDSMIDGACRREQARRAQTGATHMILVDDVNVPVKPLPNATAAIDTVTLSCLVQSDASLNNCQLADGAKASKKDEDDAIGRVNGRGHVTGAFVAGQRTKVTVVLRASGGVALLPVG